MPAARDLSKEKFGRLQPLYPTNKRQNKSIVWMCRCDCGNEKEIPAYVMTGGRVKSCGCLKKETDRHRQFLMKAWDINSKKIKSILKDILRFNIKDKYHILVIHFVLMLHQV